MLASAAILAGAIYLSQLARGCVPTVSRSAESGNEQGPGRQHGRAVRWFGGFALVGRSRYLVGVAALVVLLNWIGSTGDYVLSNWLVELARQQAPEAQAAFIGRFMGNYWSVITLVGLLVQLLLVSRIIQFAGLARALMVTPIAFLAGYLLIGVVPVFAMLESVLIVHKSLDYSLLNTTRCALLLPTSRDEKYQAKTAIDTLFFRVGDLLSTLSVIIGVSLLKDARLEFVWLIIVLSATMTLVAWLVGREYSRRFGLRKSSGSVALPATGPGAVLAQ
jgi:AAA family ATP:ADP antiporter